MGLQSESWESYDSRVGCPDTEPEQHVGDGHLGNLELCTVNIILASRPQTLNIHPLGLGLESCFMRNYSLHNGVVEDGDQGHGGEVVNKVGKQDERSLIPSLELNLKTKTHLPHNISLLKDSHSCK